MPAHNGRFHASGGVVSADTEQVTSSFTLVRALPIPPLMPSRSTVSRKQRTVRRDNEVEN